MDKQQRTYAMPFATPTYIMLKPAGALCNLGCYYCYYLEKAKLYKQDKNQIMSDELLEKFTEEYINMQTTPEVLFTWHGGETLMRPISFYQKALDYQKKYANGRRIDNSIQTNGTLLTDEWCEFFKKNNFLVGISIDGPREFHDRYRKDKLKRPSFNRVMKGIELLKKHEVEYNGMAVVNDYNGDYPIEFYNFFKEIDIHYIQFAPIIERTFKHEDGRELACLADGDKGEITPFSVDPLQWGDFLCDLFDEWIKEDVGKYYIQIFDSTLANWVGEAPGVCSMGKTCGHAACMEFNGDVYSCDHFVFPEYKIGNIYTNSLMEMMYSDKQIKFGNNKQDSLTKQCKNCKYLFACNGDCPKNRFGYSKDGEFGQNYLCEGYYQFFDHVAPYMDFMKNELQHKRPPANVMQWIKDGMPQYKG